MTNFTCIAYVNTARTGNTCITMPLNFPWDNPTPKEAIEQLRQKYPKITFRCIEEISPLTGTENWRFCPPAWFSQEVGI